MTQEETKTKYCPFAMANADPNYSLECVSVKCMAWKQVNDEEGYCKIIEGLESI